MLDDLDWAGGRVRRARAWQGLGFRQFYPLGTGSLFRSAPALRKPRYA